MKFIVICTALKDFGQAACGVLCAVLIADVEALEKVEVYQSDAWIRGYYLQGWTIEAEHRQRLSADERRKEYHEEQLNEWENYVEEEQDEQYERNREKVESWRQWHYDGLYPPYRYNRHVY
ncbi:upper zone of growth plate and cartilage matrix associated a [Rhinoraja longicauda]